MTDKQFLELLTLLASERVTIQLNRPDPITHFCHPNTCILIDATAYCIELLRKEDYTIAIKSGLVHVTKH